MCCHVAARRRPLTGGLLCVCVRDFDSHRQMDGARLAVTRRRAGDSSSIGLSVSFEPSSLSEDLLISFYRVRSDSFFSAVSGAVVFLKGNSQRLR